MGKINQYSIQSLGKDKCVIVRNPAANLLDNDFKKLVQSAVDHHDTLGITAYIDSEIGLDNDAEFFQCSLARVWASKHPKIQEKQEGWDMVEILKKAFPSGPFSTQSNAVAQFNKINNNTSIHKSIKKQLQQFSNNADAKYGIDQYDEINSYLIDLLFIINSKNSDTFASFLENWLNISDVQANAMKSKYDDAKDSVMHLVEEMHKQVEVTGDHFDNSNGH